jgi:hypothetical protein
MNNLSPKDTEISIEAARKAQEIFLQKLESQSLPAMKTWEYFRGRAVKYEQEVKAKGYPWERK